MVFSEGEATIFANGYARAQLARFQAANKHAGRLYATLYLDADVVLGTDGAKVAPQ
jgi:hypothetical protein